MSYERIVVSKKFIFSLLITLITIKIIASAPDGIKNLDRKTTHSIITSKHGNYNATVVRTYDFSRTNKIIYQQYMFLAKNKHFKAQLIRFDDNKIGEPIQLNDGRILTVTCNNKILIKE
jgi:hypothetical protein